MEDLYPESTDAQLGQEKKHWLGEVYDWMEWFVGLTICVVLLLTFGFRTIGVFGISMEQTLLEGDRLIVTRIGEVQYGDIIAISQPNNDNKPLIKRVIATGGQTIDIDFETGEVRVDGELLSEPYINEPTRVAYDLTFPLTVPEGHIFAMGDNRNHSWDSRSSGIGFIDERYILGEVVFRFMPFDRIGKP